MAIFPDLNLNIGDPITSQPGWQVRSVIDASIGSYIPERADVVATQATQDIEIGKRVESLAPAADEAALLGLTFGAGTDEVARGDEVWRTDTQSFWKFKGNSAAEIAVVDNWLELGSATAPDIWPATADNMTLPDELGLQYVLGNGHSINLPDFTQTENFDIELAPQDVWESMTYSITEAAGWTVSGAISASGTETVRLLVDVGTKTITASAGSNSPAEIAIFDVVASRPDPATTTLKSVFIGEETTPGDGTRGLYFKRTVNSVPIWDQN
jgi:hypothetical protein